MELVDMLDSKSGDFTVVWALFFFIKNEVICSKSFAFYFNINTYKPIINQFYTYFSRKWIWIK